MKNEIVAYKTTHHLTRINAGKIKGKTKVSDLKLGFQEIVEEGLRKNCKIRRKYE